MKDKLNAAKGTLLGLLIGAIMWLLILLPVWIGACDAEARPRDYQGESLSFVWVTHDFSEDQEIVFMWNEKNELIIEYKNCTPSEGAKILFDYLIEHWHDYLLEKK